MTRRLPLFPLDLVLFPGARVPLHIFEPRYRQMLVDCAATDECFGLCDPGPHGIPVPGTTGTIAEITFKQGQPDGRANIVVDGRARFTVAGLLDEGTPYYLGAVEPFDDDPGTDPDPAEATELGLRYAQYRDLVRRLTDQAPDDGPLAEEARALTFQVSAGLDTDVGIKRQLHALRSTRDRAAVLLEILPVLTAPIADAVKVRERAGTNGKGGHHHGLSL